MRSTALGKLAQIAPRIDASIVPVAELQLHAVAADRGGLFQLQSGRNPWLAIEASDAPALRAAAMSPKMRCGETQRAVRPFDPQLTAVELQ